MIRIAVIDDQEMIRIGLRGILRAQDIFQIVGEAADGLEALRVIRETRPEVVLMDIRMPGIDGVEAVRRVRLDPGLDSVKILMLTTFEADRNVIRAVQAGAQGFLGKNVGPSELVTAIEQLAAGSTALSPIAASSLVAHVASSSDRPADTAAEESLALLTSRERDIVAEASKGLTNDQIAAKLFISPYTVKTHLNRAMAKTGANDRSQLVILAFKGGLAERL